VELWIEDRWVMHSFTQSLSGSEFLMSNLRHCISAFWHLACNVPCQVPTTATTSTCNLYLLLFFFSARVNYVDDW